MTFEEWFNSDDPMVDRIGNSPDIMWQLQQAYIAGQQRQKPDAVLSNSTDLLKGKLIKHAATLLTKRLPDLDEDYPARTPKSQNIR